MTVPAFTEDLTGRFNVDDLRPRASSPSGATANGFVVQAALDIVARVEGDEYEYDALPRELVEDAAAAANGPFYGGLRGGYAYDAAPNFTYDHPSNVINYEEYHPFGTSAYRAVDSTIQVTAKRYRYAAAERDEETGLDHMGLRYYAPWLGRWTSADPIGLGDGVNRYAYVRGNPVSMRDPGGTEAEPFKVGETITRERAEEFMRDTSVGAEGTFPVRLSSGERYHVLSSSSVDILPGVPSGTEGHHAWQFQEGSTARFELQKAEALEANRIAAETSAEWGAGRILASNKMIGGFVVVGGAISLGVAAASVIAPTTFAGTVGTGAITGAGEGGIIAGGLTLLEGGAPGEALQASKTGAVYGGLGGAVGGAIGFGLARGFGAITRPGQAPTTGATTQGLAPTRGVGPTDQFAGVRELSESLRAVGVPRQARLETIQSFREGSIHARTATGEENFFRFFGGGARPKGRFLTPDFPLSDARRTLALPPENFATGIRQFGLQPGTRFFQGTVAPNFGKPGGGRQLFILDPGKLRLR